MKKFIFICTMIISSLFIVQNVEASLIGRSTYDGSLTLRNGPGENYSSSGKIYYNDTFIVYNTIPIKSDSGCSGGYLKINYNGATKYICNTYVSKENSTINTDSKQNINSRYGAGTNNKTYKSINKNKTLTLLSTSKYKGAGCSKGWYNVKYNDKSNIYICSNYTHNYIKDNKIVVNELSGTNLRKSAKSSSTKIATLKYGQALSLYSTKKYKGAGCSSGWYKVYFKNKVNYVCSAYTTKTNNVYTVNYSTGVNVRKKASTNSRFIKKLSYGEVVTLRSTKKYKGAGCSSGWYKIALNGTSAYVCSAYLTFNHNTTNITQNVSIRKGAGTNYSKIKNLSKNTKVILENTKKRKGSGCSNGWYRIKYNGTNAYVCSNYTELDRIPKTKTNNNNSSSNNSNNITKVKTGNGYYYTKSKWDYKLKENYGNIRSSASTSSAIKNTVYLGTDFKVLSSSKATSGCSAGWYKISYYNNRTGYICKSLVDKYSDITSTNSSYCNTLTKQGFPSSYCPYLSYLHKKYPNWTFKAEKTGITFAAAINGESEKNYTQISERPYITSTTVREKPNWRTASDGYVAYMLDPRNYLNEQNIFAFETLSYDKNSHTKAAIRSIVDGTYLDTDTYAGYFLAAAKKYNVSPVHLASRVKQEGGTNSSYDSVSGKVNKTCTVTSYVCSTYTKLSSKTEGKLTSSVNLRTSATTSSTVQTLGRNGEAFTLASTTKYKGTGCNDGWYKIKLTRSLKNIYNYYNIGAYGSNPVLRGLQAAAGCVDTNEGTPWDTREKAIVNGASFIANGYITKGQDTMYYQKFNTSPNSKYNKFTHQYMTNILAPAGESLSTYDSYNNLKIINKSYVFKIPVYNSMPTSSIIHPQF